MLCNDNCSSDVYLIWICGSTLHAVKLVQICPCLPQSHFIILLVSIVLFFFFPFFWCFVFLWWCWWRTKFNIICMTIIVKGSSWRVITGHVASPVCCSFCDREEIFHTSAVKRGHGPTDLPTIFLTVHVVYL